MQNITTGANSAFSLMMSVKGNCVFWPNARDSIANGLSHALLGQARSHPSAVRRSNLLPTVTSGHIAQMPVNHRKGDGLFEKFKRILEMAWNNRDSIIGGISTVA